MMIINPYFGSNAGGGGFVPTGNLRVWLKADVGVTYDGSNLVSGWADQSGNNLNAIQNTTTYKPLYQPVISGLNNKPGITFAAGGDDFMTFASNSLFNFSSGFTIYVVAKVNAFFNTFNMLIQHSNGSTWTQGWGILYYNSTSSYRFFVNNWNNAANYVDLPHTTTGVPQLYKLKWTGTQIVANIMGTVPASGTKAFSGPYTDPWAFGYSPEIARGGSTIYDFSCDIPEVLMYNSGSIGAANETGIETYLKNKYGIA
jgi:hypothetical protein